MGNVERYEAVERACIDNAFARFEGKERLLLIEEQKQATRRYASSRPTIQNMADCRVLLYLLNPDTQPDPRKE